MALSSELISQFVKATKDEPKTKKETVIYGVVTQINPDVRVKLIDSDNSAVYGEAIPVSSQTTVVDVGDKVECTIKNHKLSITGTSEYPAARNASTAKQSDVDGLVISNATITETLTANKGKIDDLETANLQVQDTLTAHNADIENLKAADVTITGRLTAAEAEIDYLQALDIDVEKLNAAYAFVDDLEASHADVDYLVSTVADIDTLMFGSAGGDVIQTSFSNSVVAQLGDAQIKSAMIDTISADKITALNLLAGAINSNKVTIASEDGRMRIEDGTIRIEDDNGDVRIQIGKDEQGDYSITICDQNGNVMFHEGGITDAAIKEAIIRNDMVSDTANIHASKLDIDSLFDEINDSSKTIKSTKVYLDDKNQTLDVAFKTLTNEVTGYGNTISSQGTKISTIQGQISSKIWQQDINTAKNEMSTQYSTLEQEVDGISSTVAGHTSKLNNLDSRITSTESSVTQLSNKITANVAETTKLGTRMTTVEQTADSLSVELENLEIGGRNLLKNSKLVAMYSNNSNVYPISCVETTENGVTFYRVKRTNIEAYPSTVLSMYSTLHKDSFMYGHMTGKQVTLSFKARVSHEIFGSFMDFTYGGESVVDFGKSNENFTTNWKTYYVTIDNFPDMTNHTGIRWSPRQFQLTADILEDFYLDIRDFKFELGNKPTDWTPAPEDVENDVLEASKTATNYLEFSSSGLVIGNLTASTLGKNVLIDSDSVDIRNGTTTLASFGADYLYLAKNSRNATIDLCNGLAKMYHQSRLSYDTLFVIETPNATEIRGTSDPLCVTSTVASKPAIKFANKDGVLGSIGMVASGTESYITRNHPSTTATYSILDTGNYYKLMDSGWFNGGVLGDNFTVYNDSSQVKYRKIGKQVQIMGTVKPRVDIVGSTTQHTIFTLPSGYRPPYAMHQVCYGSNNYTWRLTINTNGTVCFSRYGLDSGYVTAAVGHWINFQATFFID